MFPPLPIRAKIAAACAALTAAVIAVFAAGTLVNIFHEQMEAADMELESEARHVAQMMATGEFSRERIQGVQVTTVEPWVAFAVFEADGSLWRSSGAIPEEVARAAVAGDKPVTVHHAKGSWRVRSFAFAGETIVVSCDLAEVHEILFDLLLAYLLALPLAGLVAGVGGWWVATWALQPVRVLTKAAEEIRAENLASRVPTPKGRDEIARLAQVLNAMLARLEGSLRQAERFAANASHELRTPLTIMRGEIEALLRDEPLSPESERRLVSLQEETDRLDRISGNLLLLARLDAGEAPVEPQVLDMSALVAEACEDIDALAASRDVTLETAIEPGVRIRGNGDLLRRLTLNLLDNATKFNLAEGKVRCTISAHPREVRLSVGNTGPGIPAALRPRVFQRFFRADSARERAGHGLGLALSREIARAHGGELRLSDASSNGWTEFIATFPRK